MSLRIPTTLLVAASTVFVAACGSNEPERDPFASSSAANATEASAAVTSARFAKSGFVVIEEGERLWIFREGSEALDQYHAMGEPAKHVIRPAAGPERRTLKATDEEVILEYVAACEGFQTFLRERRIWVFRDGDASIDEFLRVGEPAKHVIRPGAGPLRLTVKAPDIETIEAYLRVVGA